MQVVKTIAEMRDAVVAVRRTKPETTIGFVPTMGALHAGHVSLIRAAQAQCDFVVLSIFVNPMQFGPAEDLSRYPRTLDADCDLLAGERVDVLFAPEAEEMYSADAGTTIDVGAIADRLDGASRPGHFRGVATVVAKLFNIVMPDVAFFGQKDAAQVAVVRKMLRDLNFPLRIEVGETVRESDGLAMSSRNRYLSEAERQAALVIWRALSRVRNMVTSGEKSSARLMTLVQETIATESAARLEYVAAVDADSLLPIANVGPGKGALVAVAAWIGNTRLIDNIIL